MSRRGRTTLFVSHNMSAVESLCSRVMWLEQGRVRDIGTADHVIREYLAAGLGHVADRPARVDLRNAPRTSWTTGMGRITAVEFERIDRLALQRSAWRVDFGEHFGVSIEFELDRHVSDLVVGFGLRNDRGEDVLTSHSADTPLVQLAPGRTTARGRLTVSQPWLRPGTYYVEAAVLSGSQLLDHVVDAVALSVEEQSAPGAPPVGLKKGMVAPVWTWRIE